jgi:hypothetical protein
MSPASAAASALVAARKIKAQRNNELNDKKPSLEKKEKGSSKAQSPMNILNNDSSSEEELKSLNKNLSKAQGGGLTRTKAVTDLEEEKKREELHPNDIQTYGS